LVFIQIVAAGVNHTLAVDHGDVFDGRTQADQQFHAGHRCSAGTQADNLGVFQLLVRQLEGIDHGCCGNNGGTVLVVMENRDIALLDQRALDFETLRRLDVFQIDATEGAGNALDGVDEGLRTFRLYLNVEDINAGEALEQHTLAFHYRLGSQRAEITQTENGRAVRNDRD